MAIADDLDRIAELCRAGARSSLDEMLALGPKPSDPAQGLLWEQQQLSLQDKVNRLSALVSKLTADAVIASLQAYAGELSNIRDAAQAAEAEIAKISEVSDLLTRLSKVLDLGLAILAAAAAPSATTIQAAINAADGL